MSNLVQAVAVSQGYQPADGNDGDFDEGYDGETVMDQLGRLDDYQTQEERNEAVHDGPALDNARQAIFSR
jgi:hypothetical protein